MTMTEGDIRKTGGVIFTCTRDGEADARSEADTTGDTIVSCEVSDGVLRVVEGLSGYEYSGWPEAAAGLKQNLFDRADKQREQVVDLRREFDALPRYQGSRRKVGKLVLEHTADGDVRLRAVSDTTGEHTGTVVFYREGGIHMKGRYDLFLSWEEVIERFTPQMDKYEKDLQTENEIKTAFGELPAGP